MLLNQVLSHEVQLRDAAGAPLQFTIRELLGIFLTPISGIFLALAIVVFFSADPPRLRDYVELWQAFAMWPIATMLYLTTYFIWLGICALLQMKGWVKRAYLPVLGALTLAPCVCASEILVHLMSGNVYPITVLPKIAYYFMTVQVFEFAFVRLVIPQVLGKQSALRLFRTGERSFPIARLRYMTAQEHYVRLVLDEGQVLQRARFRDLLGQLHASDGIQTHRSWWVGHGASPVLAKDGARLHLRLSDGTEVPIARNRTKQVQDWLDAHGPFQHTQNHPPRPSIRPVPTEEHSQGV